MPKWWHSACVAAVLLALPAPRGFGQAPGPVTTVSSASYTPAVSPDSLAAIFGVNLAAQSVSATLDSAGQLPTELGGTRVDISGKPAPLIYVSPGQINCLIPADDTAGTADVVVTSIATGAVSRGSVEVRAVAPALFSMDSSGKGRGTIVNGVTYHAGPFPVTTPENGGSDKRTRLSIFGTGLRRFQTAVQAWLEDSSGLAHELTVEYAGAAYGYFGLDQVNVILPAEVDGIGEAGLYLVADGVQSNRVSLVIRYLEPPLISALSDGSLPPGGQLTVTGQRFATDTAADLLPRNVVWFDLGAGREEAGVVLDAGAGKLVALVPAVPLAEGGWYRGPARICVVVDEQRTCSGIAFQIGDRVVPKLAPGETLVALDRLLVEEAADYLAEIGQAATADALRQQGQAEAVRLRGMVAEAMAGRPPMMTVEGLDGTTHMVVFDMDMVTEIESLAAANPEFAAMLETAPRTARTDTAAGGCGLPEELARERAKQTYDEAARRMQVLFYTGLVITTAGLAACLADPPLCQLAYHVVALLGGSLFAADMSLLTLQLTAQVMPNTLGSLHAEGSPLVVDIGKTAQFRVLGAFHGLSAQTARDTLILSLVMEGLSTVIGARVEAALGPAGKAVAEKFLADLARAIVTEMAKKGLLDTIPQTYEPATALVELSQRSISNRGLAVDFGIADVTLACGPGSASSATGKKESYDTPAEFRLLADKGNLMLVDGWPATYLKVYVCDYRVEPLSGTFAPQGGSGSVTVRPTSEKCRWTAQSPVPWITITSGASVTGNGDVSYSVARNTGGTRTGILTIAGKQVTVTQEGECGPGISGTWTGSGGFPGDEPWPVSGTIQQQGEVVTGTFTVKLPCASPKFPFTGTFQNNELVFDLNLTWLDWDCKPICTNVEHAHLVVSGDQMTGQGTGVDCIGGEPYVTEYRLTRSCSESSPGLSLASR